MTAGSDLAAALDRTPEARRHWDAFPPSARNQLLWWVVAPPAADPRALDQHDRRER